MDRNEAQARWLIENGWLAPGQVSQIVVELEARPDIDVCAWLVERGQLTAAQAQSVRQATNTVYQVPEGKSLFGSDRQKPPPPPQTGSGPVERPPDGVFETMRLDEPVASVVDPSLVESYREASREGSAVGLMGVDERSIGYQELRVGLQQTPGQLVGKVFNKYEVLEELGRGAVAMVLKARDRYLKREVALKLMLDESADPEGVRRFQREGKALSRLEHPNIVRLYEFGEEDRVAYMAMELVAGSDLKRQTESWKSAGGGPDPTRVVRVLRAIAEALAFCHERGVLHRDVKPSNIMIEEGTDRPVLVDFGLVKGRARQTLETSLALSKTGEIVGTPAFMAPEQLDAKGTHGEITEKTDVWGLGATLFYALTGTTPYADASSISTYVALLTRDPRRVREVRPDSPVWLDEVVARCLHREIDGRPSMAELAEALEKKRFKGQRRKPSHPAKGSKASKHGSWSKRGAARPGSMEMMLGAEAPRRSRRPFVLAALAFAFVLITGLGVVLLLAQEPPSFLRVEPAYSRTSRDRVAIEGEVSQAGVQVALGERRAVADERGRFSLEASLTEGRNSLETRILDGDGELIEKRVVEVFRDTRPPTIAFDSYDHERRRVLLAPEQDGRLVLRGRCVDDSRPVDLRGGGFRIAVNERQFFEYTIEDRVDPQILSFRATDGVGNVAKETLTVLTPKAQQRPLSRDPKTLLADRELWAKASEEAQDRAIAAVSRALGARFERLEVRSYRAGGAAHRIASFRHVGSGVELNLIPGGRYQIGCDTEEAKAILAGFIARTNAALENSDQLTGKELEEAKAEIVYLQRQLQTLILNEQPRREVVIKRPFLLGRFELRRDEWRRVLGEDAGSLAEGGDSRPVSELSREDAQRWLKRAGDGLRLPSEAEWEFACRAGTKTRYFWGGDFDPRYAWLSPKEDLESGPVPHQVTAHIGAENAFGLVDILGNVIEWCADTYKDGYLEGPDDERPVRDPEEGRFVLRGGNDNGFPEFSRCSSRWWQVAGSPLYNYSGMRVACTIPGF